MIENMNNNQVDKIAAMEWLINKLSGVKQSRILINEKNEILEMHVLADYSRSPKQIVRDIQSALAAVYDMEIDHRIISVAQIDDDLDKGSDARLKLNSIQVLAEEARLEIKVVLSMKDKFYEGVFTGFNSQSSMPHTAASATLDAVHSYIGRKNVFSLVDVKKININQLSAYIVLVCYLSGLQNEMLIGSCLIKHDEYHAIVRATLDSLNRILKKVTVKNNKD